jgi:hypothetical protein
MVIGILDLLIYTIFFIISVLFVNCIDNYLLHFPDEIKLIRSSHMTQ